MKIFGLDTNKSYTEEEFEVACEQAEAKFNRVIRYMILTTVTLSFLMLAGAVIYCALHGRIYWSH